MIQQQTIILVSDNSGAKKVLCIKVLGGTKKKYAFVGDMIKVSIKNCTSKGKVRKGDIFNALIIRTKKQIFRKDGTYIKFDNNSCILLNNNMQPIGTRIFGAVTKELREKNFLKVLSLANEII